MEDEFAQVTDDALVMRARDGDARALEELFRRYYMAAYRIAYRMCGTVEDAQDIAQEVFVRVGRALRTFRSDAKFSTWLYRVVANAAADHHHGRQRRSRLGEELQAQQQIESAPAPGGAVNEALAALSTVQRQVIILTFYEGFSHAEAAQILRRTETAVSWHVFQAKRKLKKLLAGDENE